MVQYIIILILEQDNYNVEEITLIHYFDTYIIISSE